MDLAQYLYMKKGKRNKENKWVRVEKKSVEKQCHITDEICDSIYCHEFNKKKTTPQ